MLPCELTVLDITAQLMACPCRLSCHEAASAWRRMIGCAGIWISDPLVRPGSVSLKWPVRRLLTVCVHEDVLDLSSTVGRSGLRPQRAELALLNQHHSRSMLAHKLYCTPVEGAFLDFSPGAVIMMDVGSRCRGALAREAV